MSDAKLEAYFFTVIFLATLVLSGILFFPFIGSLALALVLATLLHPLYARLVVHVKSQKGAALILTVLVTLAILLPATGLFYLLVDEIRSITEQVTVENLKSFPVFLSGKFSLLVSIFPFLSSVNIPEVLQTFFQNVGSYTATIFTGTTNLFFKFFIALIAFYYFILDGSRFLEKIISLSPLRDEEDHAIFARLKAVMQSLVRGTLVVAMLQGLLTGLGFLLFGIPNPILWGSISAVSALIPSLGTGIVSLPAIIYLFATGQVVAGIGLTAWALLIVGLVDNMIGPKLIGSGSKIHPLFVLLSVLGGLSLFGLSGFIIGPLVFGFLVALSEIYIIKVREIHERSS